MLLRVERGRAGTERKQAEMLRSGGPKGRSVQTQGAKRRAEKPAKRAC